MDEGPILGQTLIEINKNSTAKQIEEKLLPHEHLLYKSVLKEFLKDSGKKILTINLDEDL